ncbi:MAG: tRNA threonylcarbamoyladenosine dehydratase [Clostridia bacterium]|nr:tRNA threonylcarbamoyladenosine dehydratase [Clostridia bacterium]
MIHQFSRTELLLGEAAMDRLYKARVAVFGVGGVGGFTAEALIRAGVGSMDLFDNDTVSLTNLNRQIIALHSTLGQSKVQVMRDRLLDINPEANIIPHEMFYLPENADSVDLSRYDFVVDAIDTVSAKINLAVRCEALGVPLISAMGAGNKLDPTKIVLTDIYKTEICPLAKVMRTELRKRGVKHLRVAYSTEPAVRAAEEDILRCLTEEERAKRRGIPGSTSFVPSVMGLIIASDVVKTITGG